MFRKVSHTTEIVRAREANRFLEINTYEAQRPLRDRHVIELAEKISSGVFRYGEIGIAILTYQNGRRVLVNGQHQCCAVLSAQKPITARIEKYEVDSAEDLALLYRQYDVHGERSLRDILIPEALSLNVDWPTRILSTFISGLSRKKGLSMTGKIRKVELLRDHLPQGEFVAGILQAGDSTHLRRGPVVHAILETWERNREDAKNFWTLVRDGEGLSKTEPPTQAALRIRNWLLTTSVSLGRGSQRGLRSATEHEMTAKCITAWNAYRRKELTELKYYMDKPIPRAQ